MYVYENNTVTVDSLETAVMSPLSTVNKFVKEGWAFLQKKDWVGGGGRSRGGELLGLCAKL